MSEENHFKYILSGPPNPGSSYGVPIYAPCCADDGIQVDSITGDMECMSCGKAVKKEWANAAMKARLDAWRKSKS